jgi:hypothetical protein
VKRFSIAIVLMTLLAWSCASAYAAPSAYVVDVTVSTPKNTRTGKVYVSGRSARTDTTDEKGRQMISIHNAANKEFYLVFPKSHSYRVYDMDKVAKDNNLDPVPGDIKGKSMGTETVAGQLCEKLKYANGNRMGYLWVSKKTGLPVQMMSEDQKYKASYSNPVVGPQPADLFNPPAGYKRVESH